MPDYLVQIIEQLDRESAVASRKAQKRLRQLYAGTAPQLRTIVNGNHVQYVYGTDHLDGEPAAAESVVEQAPELEPAD